MTIPQHFLEFLLQERLTAFTEGRSISLKLLSAICAAALLSLPSVSHAAGDIPEAGPENAGMRLRFIVMREADGTNDNFEARFELISVTNKPITLLADFSDDKGEEFKDYVVGSTTFTVDPAVMPYMGQTAMGGPRKKPQPEYTLAPGETLTVRRAESGRRHCPTDGLYGFRASLLLRVADSEAERKFAAMRATNIQRRAQRKDSHLDDVSWPGRSNAPASLLLRSNEQQVPVGGSHALPKFAMGRLMWVNTNDLSATLDLGGAHKIQAGDEFRIFTGRIGSYWILKITHTEPAYSVGTLQALSKAGHGPDSRVLRPGTAAALITAQEIWQ